jgi:hypothetical protein
MGWENDYTLPDDIYWREVLEMASKQGVEAIALDGFDVYISKNPGAASPLKNPKTELLMFEAIGRLNLIEYNNLQHLAALLELSEVLLKKQIPFMIMKGFACGQYYPNPKHRECGDIDIYTGAKFKESNDTLKSAGVDVDPHYYRHSISYIKKTMIENHRILCDLRGPTKQTRALEAQMEEEAKKIIENRTPVRIQGHVIVGAVFPSANFNALFLPWHVSAHFEFERVTLRHLLDWALFLVAEGKNIDVEFFREAKRKYTYGYSKFADILTLLALKYLNMPARDIPLGIIEDAYNCDVGLTERVFDYMFVGQLRERDKNIWKFRWNNAKRIWQERWKYKELYGMGMFRFLLHKMSGVIFRVGDED